MNLTELQAGAYRPGRFLAFLLETPKRREIFAAKFRDRVVHHVLVGHQQPAWERRFIHDSFACRTGKGTLAGVERVRSFACRVTRNGSRRAWYLQLDIRGFFIALASVAAAAVQQPVRDSATAPTDTATISGTILVMTFCFARSPPDSSIMVCAD